MEKRGRERCGLGCSAESLQAATEEEGRISSHHQSAARTYSCAIRVYSGGLSILLGLRKTAEKATRRPIRDPETLLENVPITRKASGGLNLANSAPGVRASHPVSPSVDVSECDSAFQKLASFSAYTLAADLLASIIRAVKRQGLKD